MGDNELTLVFEKLVACVVPPSVDAQAVGCVQVGRSGEKSGLQIYIFESSASTRELKLWE